jgi:hypothetical protein
VCFLYSALAQPQSDYSGAYNNSEQVLTGALRVNTSASGWSWSDNTPWMLSMNGSIWQPGQPDNTNGNEYAAVLATMPYAGFTSGGDFF